MCLSLIHEDGREVSLDTPGRGDFFGELSFLDKKVRSATVTAVGDAELPVFPRDTFVNVLHKLHDIIFILLQTLGKRLRHADERIETFASKGLITVKNKEIIIGTKQFDIF